MPNCGASASTLTVVCAAAANGRPKRTRQPSCLTWFIHFANCMAHSCCVGRQGRKCVLQRSVGVATCLHVIKKQQKLYSLPCDAGGQRVGDFFPGSRLCFGWPSIQIE